MTQTTPSLPSRQPRRRRPLIGTVILAAALAAAFAIIGGVGSSLAQPSQFCPPTFLADGSPGPFPSDPPAGSVVTKGNDSEVTEYVEFDPSQCKPTMTVSEVHGNHARMALPETPNTTAKAVRVQSPDLCGVRLVPALNLTGKTARAHRATTCEQALLAIYAGPTPPPKTGKAVRADTCRLVALSWKESRTAARARRDNIQVIYKVGDIGGQENLLQVDTVVVRIASATALSSRRLVQQPDKTVQLKQCNAP